MFVNSGYVVPRPAKRSRWGLPYSYWFIIGFLVLTGGILCAATPGIIALVLITTDSGGSPVIASPTEGTVHFSNPSMSSVQTFSSLKVYGNRYLMETPHFPGSARTSFHVEQGNVEVESGDLYVNGYIISDSPVVTPSDMRIKTNTELLDSKECLSNILQLEPKTFVYKGKENELKFGFIAQEVREVIPSVVKLLTRNIGSRDNKDIIDDFHVLETNQLIPVLVAAIKELQNEIENLKN